MRGPSELDKKGRLRYCVSVSGPMPSGGGEGGIRTPGRLPVNGFQDRRLQPLGHLSDPFDYVDTPCISMR